MTNKIQVAIIGAGPSGIYAGEAILKKLENAHVTFIESLPTPFGLVRSGVAPDHFKIKEVSRVFEKTLSNPRVTFLGNIQIDKDISVEALKKYFNIIILCHGTTKDRRLGIEGEDLEGMYPATDFVGWYNSHPDFNGKIFNIETSSSVVIIGQGNVALDIARVILKDPKELAPTDISEEALSILKSTKIKDVYLVGRRGPLQIACTDKELSEFSEIENLAIHIQEDALNISKEEENWLSEAPKGTRKNFEVLKSFLSKEKTGKSKNLHILFNLSPIKAIGKDSLERMLFSINTLEGPLEGRKAVSTDDTMLIDCTTLFKSVGYLGTGLKGLPFIATKGIYPNESGAIINDDGQQIQGIYTSGWIKRGPSGVIGTNKQDSAETVEKILSDMERLDLSPKEGLKALEVHLRSKDTNFTTYKDWKSLDQFELNEGTKLGKCRNKFLTLKDMLSSLT